ncbi:glycosyltransferase [Nitrosopumilus sp.]|uniref:rhamnosyltransferase WsaF family glycosyltransferase n=1 Tax=Nitrosopumilus sp. TaxID=2024843 RepID=UPI00292ED400|nr:glycosyltransferase [Nitrosopumilus sp.]
MLDRKGIEKDIYDKNYYDNYIPDLPYVKNEHWEKFFDSIAEKIENEINPKTVLDVGCAKGFLVEKLRKRGIEAYGIDISEYAISQVDESIKDYCKVGSILEEFDRKYDLIICIEVVEHLYNDDSKIALDNLCNYSDDILFSSSPIDFEEETHHNVQNPSYWASLFAKKNFFRDVKFDATLITPWAGRFKKNIESNEQILGNYEDKIWKLNTQKVELEKDFEYYKKEFETNVEERKKLINKVQNESKDYFTKEIASVKAELEGEIEQKNQEIASVKAELEGEIEQKNQEIASVKAELEGEIEQKNQEIASVKAELEGEIEQKNQEIASVKAELEGEIEQKEGIIWKLRDDLAKSQSELGSIKSSPAWRIMPLAVNKLNNYFPNGSKRRDIFDRIITRKLIQESSKPTKILRSHQDENDNRLSDNDAYNLWIKLNEPDVNELENQKELAKEFILKPLISIITPTYETPKEFLEQLVESLLDQTYSNWELCIADGNSNKKTKKILEEISLKDKRIKVKFLNKNLHISGNSNEALKIANGEYIGLLDHDDILSKDCLFEIVKCINENLDTDFIYTDKDMITEDARKRFNPLFKPDWSPEILLSANYLTHFNVIRKSLVDNIKGFRTETDGAQDWDIFFRITERTDKIKHIPKILYHWRETKTSVSSGIQSKPYVTKTQKITLEQHLKRIGSNAEVIFDEYSYPHYNWKVEENFISILIPSLDEYLDEKIINEIIENTEYSNFEIIVVTNQDIKLDMEKFHKNVKITKINDKNDHFSICLEASKTAMGDYIVFYNNELKLENSKWLHEINGMFSIDKIAVIGGMIYNDENEIVHSGKIISPDGIGFNLHYKVPKRFWGIFGSVSWYRNYLTVSDSIFSIKRKLFENIECNTIKSVEELTVKLHNLGYRIVVSPDIAFRSNNEKERKIIANFKTNTFDILRKKIDPYFNQNILFHESVPILNVREKIDLNQILKQKLNQLNKKTNNITKADNNFILGKYQQDALYLADRFDFSQQDLEKSKSIQNLNKIVIKSIAWFLPDFNNAFFGGINTILRLASFLKDNGIKNYFVMIDGSEKNSIKDIILNAFPNLNDSEVISLRIFKDLNKIPNVDVTICTLWTTAYYSLKFNKTKRKFYLIQDYEPQFYPAGSTMGQVEATYRFGFYGITNTKSLKYIYSKQYKGIAEHFDPALDIDVFYPPKVESSNKTITIFTYGRPDHPRNGFEISMNVFKKLKEKYGDKIRIISAGAVWDPKDLGLGGIVENLGILDYKETGEIFRKSDIGLVMMYTKHPSYIPLELMACKCLVISNYNPATIWLLKDKENCLLAEPSVTSFYEKLCTAIDNSKKRDLIINNSLKTVNKYSNWEPQFEKIFSFMKNPNIKSKSK